jgi:ribosomal-protein-alanine N-acetyltransferase
VNEIQLCDYEEADLPAVHALDQVCFPPGIAYSRAELRSFLHHPSSFSTVARAGDSILGFAIVRPVRRLSLNAGIRSMIPVLHLLTIDVAPAARRQGVGGSLMGWVVAKAEHLHTRSIVLEVAVDNDAAQCFYRNFGFCVTGSIPGYYNGTIDALQLERAR